MTKVNKTVHTDAKEDEHRARKQSSLVANLPPKAAHHQNRAQAKEPVPEHSASPHPPHHAHVKEPKPEHSATHHPPHQVRVKEPDPVVDPLDKEDGKVERIRRSLETAIKQSEAEAEDDDTPTKGVVRTYAQTLHRALNIMWFPMVLMGRLPFSLKMTSNTAIIEVSKTSFPYIFCSINCIVILTTFMWITAGMIILAGKLTLKSEVLRVQATTLVSIAYTQRYWLDVFIVWTTLLQASISSAHILYNAKDLADFVKTWYQVLDTTKIEVSRTLALYIIKSLVVFIAVVLAIVIFFFLDAYFKSYEAACEILVIALAQPLIIMGQYTDEYTRYSDGRFYFQKYAAVGLIIYVACVIFSWLYIMMFMVFCRCFRIGLKGVNERIAMVLNVDDVPKTGPNAIRLTYTAVHRDYLGIATTGIRIGKIFSWTMCNYYLWTMLVLVIELGEIFKFAKRDYDELHGNEKQLEQYGFAKSVHPVEEISGDLIHFIVTCFNVFYVSYEGAGAHREGKRAYEIARYKGLVDCHTQFERNFIRSIWIVVSNKVPVHVSPGKYFGVTNSTVLTVFVTAFTYFIFWVQSLGLDHQHKYEI